jgi:predicted enzyme related to lactoylglutathione lyase
VEAKKQWREDQRAGTPRWSELTTRDKARLNRSIRSLGWTAHSAPGADMDYTEFTVNQPFGRRYDGDARARRGRAVVLMPTQAPIATRARRKWRIGASLPPQDIPKTGRAAVLNDPQGAIFVSCARA